MTRKLKEYNIEIWHDAAHDEYYVYASGTLVRVCPSMGMACEVAAGSVAL